MTKRFFSFLLASLMLLTAFSVTAAGPEAITGSISVTNRHPGIGDSVRATVEIANHTDAAVKINEFKLTNKDEVLMEYAALPEPNGGGFSSGGRASSKNITVVGGVSSGGGGGGGSFVTPFSGIIEAGQSMTKDITFTVGELPVELKLTASSEAIGSSIELASLTLTQQEEKAAEGAITLSKQFPMSGETITATASITNHTGKAIDFSSIRLMREDKNLLAPESTGQEDTPPAELTASVKAGETKSWTAEMEITALPIRLKLIVASEELGTEVVLASVTIEDAVNLELSEINQLQKDSTDSALVFELTGAISNSGNLDAANVTVEVKNAAAVYGTTQISEIAAGAQQPFALTATVPKADFLEETLELSAEAKCGDKSAAKKVTLTNIKYLKDIIVNNGQALKIIEGKTFTIPEDFVAFVPETAATAYSIESSNQEIATVSEDGKTVTAVKKGEAKLKVTAGKVVKEVGLTVTPVMKNGELSDVSFYYMDGENKVALSLDKEFEYFTHETKDTPPSAYENTNYRIDIPDKVRELGVEYSADSEEAVVSIQYVSSRDRVTSVEPGQKISLTSCKAIHVISKIENTYYVYVFKTNHLPTISSDFPTEIKAYVDYEKQIGLSLELELRTYYEDAEDEKDLLDKNVSVLNEHGEKIGSAYTDNSNDNRTEVYWTYTQPAEDKEPFTATFVFKDKDGGEVRRNVKITPSEDDESPRWESDSAPWTSNVSYTSASIKWNKATDNDMVEKYIVTYYDTASRTKTKTVTAGKDRDTETTLSSLTSGTRYYVSIKAVDRSGNEQSGKSINFYTASSSGGGNGGGGGGNGGGNGAISPTPTPGITPEPSDSKFTDLEGYEWAQKEIDSLSERGIVKGITDTTFSPEANIKRADFVLLLMRALEMEGAATADFEDVAQGDYYYEAVSAARTLGIVMGGPDNRFRPEESITREDMMVMTTRALQALSKIEITEPDGKFGDDNQISDYAKQSVYALVAAKIVTGDDLGNVNPKSPTRRAEAAVIIYRILGS